MKSRVFYPPTYVPAMNYNAISEEVYDQKHAPPRDTAGKKSSGKSRIPIYLDESAWDLEEQCG
ncbi:MAG: hypothetical protein ACRD38_10745 [Nitrososphaerales archaeon]